MAEIKDRILTLRNEKELTQEKMAKIFNVGLSTVSMWEQGKRIPRPKILQEICDYFNVDMDYLMGRSEIKNKYRAGLKYDWEKEEQTKKNSESNIDMNNIIKGDEFSMIPLYESISAGYGSEEADFIEMLAIPTLKNPQDCFAVRVRGDSMEDKIEDGSIIIVRRDCCIDDGEIGAFFYEGKSIVKQKKIYKNTIVLRSYNKEYKDLIVDEYSEFKEYGKVVMSINRF